MRRDRAKQGLFAAAVLAAVLAGCAPVETGAPAPVSGTRAAPGASTMGGAIVDPARPFAENLDRSNDHNILAKALRAADLTATLSSPGDFTIFAPTDRAFDRLPPTTVETLLDPLNKRRLASLLQYHILPGRRTRASIAADIRAGGGTAIYRTQAGGIVRARLEGDNIVLLDSFNLRSSVTQADIVQSNAVVHVVDTVLLPTPT